LPTRKSSEGDGLGVNAVGTAHHRRVFKFPCPALQDLNKALQVFGNESRGLLNEQSLCGIDYVVGGEAIVKPAGVRTHDFGHRCGKGNHIMANFGFNFVNALHIEIGPFADGFCGRLGNLPASAKVSVAATSTANQVRKRFSSLQMRPISGRV
jgi:hypothetical protein